MAPCVSVLISRTSVRGLLLEGEVMRGEGVGVGLVQGRACPLLGAPWPHPTQMDGVDNPCRGRHEGEHMQDELMMMMMIMILIIKISLSVCMSVCVSVSVLGQFRVQLDGPVRYGTTRTSQNPFVH